MTPAPGPSTAGPARPPARVGRLARLMRRLSLFRRDEGGNGAIELVILLPLVTYVFMAAFESGFYMTRRVMLERSVDLTIRSLRLGQYTDPTSATLKTQICERAPILTDCANAIRIELVPVSTDTWALPGTVVGCVDRDEEIQPATTFNPGAQNELMLVRVCIVQDALFPGTGIGQQLSMDDDGGYPITAVSSFVNEP